MGRSLAIRGATLVTMEPEIGVIEEGLLVLEDDRIKEVGPDTGRDPSADEVLEGRGRVALPGLVNAHVHSRPARALGDGLPVPEWHVRYADGVSRVMDDEDSRIGALLAFGECLLAGYTSALAMPVKSRGCFRGAVEVGIRACIAPHAADNPDFAGTSDTFEENLALVEECGISSDGRVQSWLGYDNLSGSSDDFLRALRREADARGVPIHGHLCEHRAEVSYGTKRWDKRPPQALWDLGVLGPDFVAAHCVWFEKEDIDLFARSGSRVVHNPVSNLKFGNGASPVLSFLQAGVTVALGTDGMLSAYRLDPFETMRHALALHRFVAGDAAALSTEKALEMATLHGAKALGIEAGALSPGLKADVTLLDMRRLHLTPRARGAHDNLIALLVWSAAAADVETVIVDGRVVVREGKLTLADGEAVRRKAQESSERILERLDTSRSGAALQARRGGPNSATL
ncbi:MAG: amidohydrolase family protein [Nitrospinota bacterium]